MRAEAVIHGVPITTTVNGLRAAIEGLTALREMGRVGVKSLQEYHESSPKLDV